MSPDTAVAYSSQTQLLRYNQNTHFNKTIKEFSETAKKNFLLQRLPTELLNVFCYYWNDHFNFKLHLLHVHEMV